MLSKYQAGLDAHSPANKPGKGRGDCGKLSRAIKKVFPELRLVAGYYYCPYWGKQQHWWCVSPEGDIVDPTACQFPSQDGDYEELAEENRPVGECMDCGEDVFRKDRLGNDNPYAPNFCNKNCSDATEAYLGIKYIKA